MSLHQQPPSTPTKITSFDHREVRNMGHTKHYADRDIMSDELSVHYCAHVRAMTSEGLHSKADIAAELAYRDWRIEELQREVDNLAAESLCFRDKTTELQRQNAELVYALTISHEHMQLYIRGFYEEGQNVFDANVKAIAGEGK
jgi:hypothetical protein